MILSTLKDLKMPSAPRFNICFVQAGSNLTTGVGHFNIHGYLNRDFGIDLRRPFLVIHDRQSLDLKHTNIYAYSYLNFLKNVTFTLGVSGDFTRGESPDTEKHQPGQPEIRRHLESRSQHHATSCCVQGLEKNSGYERDPRADSGRRF